MIEQVSASQQPPRLCTRKRQSWPG